MDDRVTYLEALAVYIGGVGCGIGSFCAWDWYANRKFLRKHGSRRR